jgi:6,7-dimethyl-8-ribityllumazine synthase
MATAGKDLSAYNINDIPNAATMVFGIVVSEWNHHITGNLLIGAKQALLDNGALPENIHVHYLPGSFELPLGAQWLFEHKNVDAVVTLGSVIQGETKHFDFVCEGVAQGCKDVMLKYSKPVIFGVLTDNTEQQAIDRSGGLHGNKGIECAVAAIKMVAMKNQLK